MAIFLKSLDIFGFKSFADRTHIEFADGITALVGPNGCGKSNVVDAIKWVLAERQAKNLRALNMEDVIFGGTERRNPLNVAEVTLTIENNAGLLPLDAGEIAIKRRLYRSGEGEYFINGNKVGPQAIRQLFMDTGVGKSAYSVMEQGKIDQILSSKPEDRRYLFEEAAGISHSKAECAETERELERTRINMGQLEVSLSEAKKNYDTLEVQAQKTKQWRAIKDNIFKCEMDVALLRLKGFLDAKTRGEETLTLSRQKAETVRAQIEAINSELLEGKDAVDAMQKEVSRRQADLIGLQKEKVGKQAVAEQCNVRSRQTKEKIGQLEARRKTITEEVESITEEIDEEGAQLHSREKQLSDATHNIETYTANIEEASRQMTDNDKAAEEANGKIKEIQGESAAAGKELALITEDIVKTLDWKLKSAGFSASNMAESREKVDTSIAALKVFAAGRRKVFADAARLGTKSGAQCAAEAEAAFAEAARLGGEVESAVKQYVSSSPAFITEFLTGDGIITKKRECDERIARCAARVDEVQKRISQLHDTNASLVVKINGYRDTLAQLKVNEAKMKAQKTASEEKLVMLRKSLSNGRASLLGVDGELSTENSRLEDIEEELEQIREDLGDIERRGVQAADALKELDAKIAERSGNMTSKEVALQKYKEEEKALAAQCEALSLTIATSDTEIRNLKQNFQDTHSRDLMEGEERMGQITESSVTIRTRLANAKEELRALGQVNHMAVEEFNEAKDRYDRLRKGYDDLTASMENLKRVADEIKAKASETFLDTYNKIKKNFHNMFRRLFGGGRAELRLCESDNVLSSGIDIFAQPPGKKLENITLLSGGEKTMTAVALLFATYQVRPSPFCLLDEIDAALDDKNVSCFAAALRSFAQLSQYIVITHNRHTIVGTARTMIGVTMQESGVSGVLSYPIDPTIKANAEDINNDFIEEEVEAEKATIPPRPAPRKKSTESTQYASESADTSVVDGGEG